MHFISILLLVAADQLTKLWAVTRLKPAGSIPVIPGFFSLTYVENQGAAWGMLAGRQFFLVVFSLLTLGFLLWRRERLFGPLPCGRLTMTLLFGGIIGNLIDRVRLSHVIDFLDFYWGRHHFPAFNIADSAICCGVFLFILTQWLHEKGNKEQVISNK
jgi:signal peptidase II